jgi:quercetin dioxygenase-like cupin family protein
MYRTNLRDVPKVDGLKRDDGWVDLQVQFLIDKKSAGANHVVGWTVLKPGARHENHRQRNCDEFFIVLRGKGMIYTDHGDKPLCWSGAGWAPSSEGDVVYSPRGCWHGFNNTSTEDASSPSTTGRPRLQPAPTRPCTRIAKRECHLLLSGCIRHLISSFLRVCFPSPAR